MSRPHGAPSRLWISLGLAAAIFCIYFRVANFDFVNLDDQTYVVNNPHVADGLTGSSLAWAFKTAYAGYWFPLTLASYMLDAQIYGLRAGGFHLTNLVLHIASTLLLFLIFDRMTGARWRSAFVAFVFGMHPMHTEAVAWIAERKEVLSGLFWMLAMWAYLRYVESSRITNYLLLLAALCCGLMSKPMIVTLPFVLLLLDYWPLRRFEKVPARRLLLEKLPLLAACAICILVTIGTQRAGGAVSSLDVIPAHIRLENALESYVFYAWRFMVPVNLAVIYPYSLTIPAAPAIFAGFMLAAVTGFMIRVMKKQPYLSVSWLWFVGTLVPVIGLVQAGLQARADRYTYIPYIGLSVALAWWAADFFKHRRWPNTILTSASIFACAGCALAAWSNVAYWQNSVTLFRHASEVTQNNWAALAALGQALISDGRTTEAIPHLEKSIEIQPNFPDSHITLASAYSNLGEFDPAEGEFRAAVRLEPQNPDAQEGLGMILTEKNQVEEALAHLQKAIALRPDDADSHYNLGRLYALSARPGMAVAEFRETIHLRPDYPEAEYNLGTALATGHEFAEACRHFERALQLKPDYTSARFNLAGALASMGLFEQAIPQFEQVLRVWPDNEPARAALEQCLRMRSSKRR